jgi:hypothetical protein
VPVSSSGQITIFSTAATKVIVRLRGWYSVAPPPDGADWAQYHNGPARLGTNDAEPVLTPSTVSGLGQAWAAVAGAPVRSEPAVVGQVVYAAAFNGTVRALDVATGTTIWTAATASGLRASPAVVDGVVYIGASDGRVHALDAATGATIWTVASPYGWGEPALAGGILYATMARGLGSCDLRALDAATGAGVWTIPGGPNVCVASDPAVANGVLFHGSSGVLMARNAATGAFLYSDSPTPADLSAPSARSWSPTAPSTPPATPSPAPATNQGSPPTTRRSSGRGRVVTGGRRGCPRRDSNPRTRLRRPVLYPLSYGGDWRADPWDRRQSEGSTPASRGSRSPTGQRSP